MSQIEYANLDRAAAAAHKPRPPKAPRQEASEGQAAPSRADRASEATSLGSDAGSDAGSSAEPAPSKGLSAARELADGMDVDEKLKLAAELQDGMTPQELRQARYLDITPMHEGSCSLLTRHYSLVTTHYSLLTTGLGGHHRAPRQGRQERQDARCDAQAGHDDAAPAREVLAAAGGTGQLPTVRA